MPFTHDSKAKLYRKTRRTLRKAAEYAKAFTGWALYSPSPEEEPMMVMIGRTKPKTPSASQGARDIGKILSGTTRPKPVEWVEKEHSTNPSDDEVSQPPARPSHSVPLPPSKHADSQPSAPSTKQDISNLYDRIRKLFDADIALVKQEVQVITEQ
ncbi:Hypothetical predicted protein, partial [Pelobates cultripes]